MLFRSLVLSFYFKIGEPRSPDCNDKKNSLLGTKRKCSCNVCVNVCGLEKSWGGSGLFYFREKGCAKRDFHDGWGWVIVCVVKNSTHYNSCLSSK